MGLPISPSKYSSRPAVSLSRATQKQANASAETSQRPATSTGQVADFSFSSPMIVRPGFRSGPDLRLRQSLQQRSTVRQSIESQARESFSNPRLQRPLQNEWQTNDHRAESLESEIEPRDMEIASLRHHIRLLRHQVRQLHEENEFFRDNMGEALEIMQGVSDGGQRIGLGDDARE
ncbi:hypothetical protein K461DRAFT_270597 [Myriangium duriaei CBS 260.36]|uniref:Uncharacterized protein n=1 Tax=Myriangium duriaei CBS 260.36 TaxID=1168546 RepID=A0A9P4IYA6_9PEZI|nr:hypothetical protein K461DRAFT_270597 [Myriangium duriaei CBS 260.36]